jgi:hypothetical protein
MEWIAWRLGHAAQSGSQTINGQAQVLDDLTTLGPWAVWIFQALDPSRHHGHHITQLPSYVAEQAPSLCADIGIFRLLFLQQARLHLVPSHLNTPESPTGHSRYLSHRYRSDMGNLPLPKHLASLFADFELSL